jgi:hypothetical protein
MIEMPRRSVTRFFIPLIDVLLLLFVVFLLMPINTEKKSEKDIAELMRTNDILQRENSALRKQLERLKKIKEGATFQELQKLEREIRDLQDKLAKAGPERTQFHIIDVDPDNGEIYYFDPKLDPPKTYLKSQADVQKLLDQQKKNVPDRERYYFFLTPRGGSDYPTQAQVRQYREWFKEVPSSLKGGKP